MGAYVQDTDFTLYLGEAELTLRGLPAESVHCVVTSPPYWGLRDYGTGQWVGGDDPDCDHQTGRGAQGPNSKNLKAEYPAFAAHRGGNPLACPKCGAERHDHQLGLEATPEEYVTRLVGIFREIRRVLRSDGTAWLNLGDTYASAGGHTAAGATSARQGRSNIDEQNAVKGLIPPGLKGKDLVGIPWMAAFALRADGWYLRSEIIWAKPNPMPESVNDRPTKSHEQVFLLTKSPRYYYDLDAIREPFAPTSEDRYDYAFGGPKNEAAGVRTRMVGKRTFPGGSEPTRHGIAGPKPAGVGPAPGPRIPQAETLDGIEPESPRGADGRRVTTRPEYHDDRMAHENHHNAYGGERWPNPTGRNKRSVWEINTEPYPDAHFAVFPTALVEPCIKAGTSERGCCAECGTPWRRMMERERVGVRNTSEGETGEQVHRPGVSHDLYPIAATTIGWEPACRCDGDPVPCTVLDPFLGSGTTALVARRLGRRSIGIELSETYATLAASRLQQLSLLA